MIFFQIGLFNFIYYELHDHNICSNLAGPRALIILNEYT